MMDERFEPAGDIIKMSSPFDKAGALFGPPKPNHAAKVWVHSIVEVKLEREFNPLLTENICICLGGATAQNNVTEQYRP